jgi:2-polyprenyl-3-methyl-5-hydroxy-6-metoxy-1,4-benzoquinol methylase
MTLDPDEERRRLEQISLDSWYARGPSGAAVGYCTKVFARHWRGGRCLELGPAEGVMTEALVAAFDHVELVEGSELFAADLAQRFPAATVHCSLFEEYEPSATFDAIVLGHVLEHVDSPRALLARARGWLAPGGAIYAAVPNARSVHRQAAVLMALLETEHSLNATDVHHGHRRVYDPESLRADVLGAGLRISVFGGYWLKPVSNAQIEEHWNAEMLEAFMALGERYPDTAAEIYVVATA